MSEVELRLARLEDAGRIAELHTRSWREHYRGSYSDGFLDGDALSDRLRVWGERLGGSAADGFTVVAEANGALIGFAYVVVDEDPRLQNLHVGSEWQRQGVGSRLVAEVLRAVPRLHVWVREDNAKARAFYEGRGGTLTGRELGGPFADGSTAPVLRFAWARDH